jgi:hypothetical protein
MAAMRVRQRYLAALVAVCALTCALPARALASGTEESILMDDQQLIYSSPQQTEWTLQQAKALGIDRVKVSVVWYLVAPDPNSKRAPKFDASNPDAYPYGAWARYDRIVSYAQQLGLRVYFQLTPPAPAWAVGKNRPTQGYPWSQKPSASEFGQFVEAVARRYSGGYVPRYASDRAQLRAREVRQLPIPLPGQSSSPPPAAQPLPRVDYWGIWNEPNEGAWLNPQWRLVGRHRHLYYVAPAEYRGLVDSAYRALRDTGHGNDTILIGETASHGWIYPLPFVRALYCVGQHNRPLRGTAAANLECPRSGNARQFVAQHPGLFFSTGYAHHPYSFDVSPDTRMADRNLITLQNLSQLEGVLNAIFRHYGHPRRGGVPMYLTEWGYKTNPPNPYVRTSLTEQAAWLNQGEFMTWQDSYVRGLAQFLLIDDSPRATAAKGSRAYWSTFQTGLLFANESPKPSYSAFRIPIWLPHPRHGSRVTVWAQLRPANHAQIQYGVLQYLPRGSHSWSDLRVIQTGSPEGFLVAHVPIPHPGAVRMAWLDPSTGAVLYSRTVGIR